MKRLNQSGFTLIELLVTMVLLGIVGLMVANFIVQWLQASSLSQTRTNLLTNSETALDTMSQDIRLSGNADDRNRWPDPNGPGGNPNGWQSNANTLVLAKVAVDKSNNIIFSDQAKYIPQKDSIVYYLSGSTIYRRTIVSDSPTDAAKTSCPAASATPSCPADTVIATGVTSFALSYYDAAENVVVPDSARSVQMAITMSAKQNTRTITASYNTRMVFRNE